MLDTAPKDGFIDARTAAYGSAYCIVRLTAGWAIPPGLVGGALPNPLGAGSENAPYASMLGLPAATPPPPYPPPGETLEGTSESLKRLLSENGEL